MSADVREGNGRLVEEHHPELADRGVERRAIDRVLLHVDDDELDVGKSKIMGPTRRELR